MNKTTLAALLSLLATSALAFITVGVSVSATSPGSKEFRKALRDALEASKNVTGSHGVFNLSAHHLGFNQRARVMVKVEGGNWKLVK